MSFIISLSVIKLVYCFSFCLFLAQIKIELPLILHLGIRKCILQYCSAVSKILLIYQIKDYPGFDESGKFVFGGGGEGVEEGHLELLPATL